MKFKGAIKKIKVMDCEKKIAEEMENDTKKHFNNE